MCLPTTEARKPTPGADAEAVPALTLEHIALDPDSATGQLARQLLELRKRVEALERHQDNQARAGCIIPRASP